jgi:nitrite reductase/ring-hydroxylating ferredoxin subunit
MSFFLSSRGRRGVQPEVKPEVVLRIVARAAHDLVGLAVRAARDPHPRASSAGMIESAAAAILDSGRCPWHNWTFDVTTRE